MCRMSRNEANILNNGYVSTYVLKYRKVKIAYIMSRIAQKILAQGPSQCLYQFTFKFKNFIYSKTVNT